MRTSSVIAVGFTTAAFVISLLCLFAGSSKSFLQKVDLMTVNISRIGHTSLFNTSDGDGSILGDLANDVQGDINNLFSDVGSDIANALDLPDFFLVYLTGYCKGTYKPNATVLNPTKEIISCSNHTALFHFKPTAIIDSYLPNGTTLEDLHWPTGIEDAERALNVAGIAMSIFYIIGVISESAAIFAFLWTVCLKGHFPGCFTLGVLLLAFLATSVGSVISTIIATKAVNVIEKYGDSIGIGAERGIMFLGMTWAAVAAVFLATMLSKIYERERN